MSEPSLTTTPDGRTLAFSEWGIPDGRPIFWLHGTPGGRLLRHVQGEYERCGARVITYDRPGYGGSDRLQGRAVSHAAGDVATIADALGIDLFAVVGVSGGGPHALAVAAGLPDRITRCATIVGLGQFDAPDLDSFDGMDEDSIEEYRLELQGEEYLLGQMYEETKALIESLPEALDVPPNDLDMLQAMGRDALSAGPYGLADDCASLLQPWGFDVADVSCATRVMSAKDDTGVPRGHGLWIAAHVSNGTFVEVDGGHFGPRDEQEEDLFAWATGL